MKIKELSALTGVSERTIYYYIDDKIFVPETFSENYAGRKSYNFTENDVKQLKQISLLRKYSFPVKDIKLLKKEQIGISDVLKRLISESRERAEEINESISTLENALSENPENLDDLCELLSNPKIEEMPAVSDGKAATIWGDFKLVLRALGLIGLWIIVFISFPENTVLKFLLLPFLLFIPLVLDTVAFILEVTEKGGIIRLISRVLRVIMVLVFVLNLVYMTNFSIKEANKEKNAKLYSFISSEAFVGIPEDENTVYIIDEVLNETADSRPPAKYNYYPVLINAHCYTEKIGMDLTVSNEKYPENLSVDFTYCENINLIEGLLISMEKRDVRKIYSGSYYKSNLEEYKTDDGYKVSSYYALRHYEHGQNWYYFAVVGNGQFLAVRLDTELEIDFDEMGIEDYCLNFLREIKN